MEVGDRAVWNTPWGEQWDVMIIHRHMTRNSASGYDYWVKAAGVGFNVYEDELSQVEAK